MMGGEGRRSPARGSAGPAKELIRGAVLIGLLLAATAVTAGTAAAQQEIQGPAVIDEPGHYVLGTDIAADRPGPVIEIRASNVTLDGAGHAIDGGGRPTVGVQVRPPSPPRWTTSPSGTSGSETASPASPSSTRTTDGSPTSPSPRRRSRASSSPARTATASSASTSRAERSASASSGPRRTPSGTTASPPTRSASPCSSPTTTSSGTTA